MAEIQTQGAIAKMDHTVADTESRVIACDVPPSVLARLRRQNGTQVLQAHAAELSARTIADTRPDMVVAPLFGPVLDICELGAFLAEIGYRGTLAVLTPPLPNPEIVREELTTALPELTVQLVTLPLLAAA
ncbi:hypothetical protein LV82_00731 [Albidovulum inexpectatum]|uniref:Uncharacterized protein n=1 Tax=Albidovulum inexpectatum TaxID=196587 RepID=A0A2S5JJ95_9RHOB|nr:hypothetical protein [Albidovulum inexpectatum]PPB81522.1 hypothetical protein LV82_00731 [Albidovulum inexpectatum]